MNATLKDSVRTYYGEVLKSSSDLKTSACCSIESVPLHLRELIADIHPEVLNEIPADFQMALCRGWAQQAFALEVICELWRLAEDHLQAVDVVTTNRRDRIIFRPGSNICADDASPFLLSQIVSRCTQLPRRSSQRCLAQ